MQELLAAGPSYVHSVLKQRLQEAGLTGDSDTRSSETAADGQAGQAGLACDPEACLSRLCHSSNFELNSSCSQPQSAPLHALAPVGCRQRVLQGSLGPACHGGNSYLGTTGLAIGRHDALAAPEVWQSIDAVLDCGEHPHPGWVAPATYHSFVVCKCEHIADNNSFFCAAVDSRLAFENCSATSSTML